MEYATINFRDLLWLQSEGINRFFIKNKILIYYQMKQFSNLSSCPSYILFSYLVLVSVHLPVLFNFRVTFHPFEQAVHAGTVWLLRSLCWGVSQDKVYL